ncbi:Hypothetical protein NTJ_15256 [Nesidiocoris tenuis]|uniref:Uncharacterized protein n=1 Tax=Nesidiocoris tenuis TaxID=355587 RepID=A0ABN7BGY1_9HEMI|nr:Hypothetical protein NTJ_15256 [Nesidiocoris tenuis]
MVTSFKPKHCPCLCPRHPAQSARRNGAVPHVRRKQDKNTKHLSTKQSKGFAKIVNVAGIKRDNQHDTASIRIPSSRSILENPRRSRKIQMKDSPLQKARLTED